MKITLDISPEIALTVFEELNRDEGMRERAVNRLMQQSGSDWVSAKTAVIQFLGALSAGLLVALEENKLLNRARRSRELFLLAFPNSE